MHALFMLYFIYLCMLYAFMHYACSLVFLVWALWHGLDDPTYVRSLEVAIWSYLHPSISTALMRPRRPKQYCLQLYIYTYIYISLIENEELWFLKGMCKGYKETLQVGGQGNYSINKFLWSTCTCAKHFLLPVCLLQKMFLNPHYSFKSALTLRCFSKNKLIREITQPLLGLVHRM